ncbi:hypothetical protein S7335_542 [Synechococcus sp. PCC 7335]|uniref:hypothetical protein n=1 Tax=Synechococcus sp. (strain ATCC 29403 / PCC 7335) TaxID=91464 RepID=UPI00017EE837|nr:hypothetical protein [Synechococcus sp. PCC 7335]EDX83362.1 hypothetical protein S7335_542 [Synechococcus sp. PCC 7335]
MSDFTGSDKQESTPEKVEARVIANELKQESGWLDALPDCPCTVEDARENSHFDEANWFDRQFLEDYHPGAETAFRSADYIEYEASNGETMYIGQQCTFDQQGNLIIEGPGAGTPDSVSPEYSLFEHTERDVDPWEALGSEEYNETWQPNQGEGCDALSELSSERSIPNDLETGLESQRSLESFANTETQMSIETSGETSSFESESQTGSGL